MELYNPFEEVEKAGKMLKKTANGKPSCAEIQYWNYTFTPAEIKCSLYIEGMDHIYAPTFPEAFQILREKLGKKSDIWDLI